MVVASGANGQRLGLASSVSGLLRVCPSCPSLAHSFALSKYFLMRNFYFFNDFSLFFLVFPSFALWLPYVYFNVAESASDLHRVNPVTQKPAPFCTELHPFLSLRGLAVTYTPLVNVKNTSIYCYTIT